MLKEIARLKEQNIGEDNPQMLALRKGYEDLIEYRKLRTGLGEGETLNKIGIFTYREYAETYLDVLKHRIAAIDKQRQLLEDFIDSQASVIQGINDHFLELETIRFSIASQKELHMQLVRKLDQVNILSKYGGYKIEVVLQPSEPTLPFAPNKSKYALLTILLGGITGFAFAFLRDMTDRTFRTPDAISAALGIHLLAQMPSFKMTQKYRKELDLSASSEPGTPVGSLFAYHFPDSVQCETFRALRSKVFLNSRVKPRRSSLSPIPATARRRLSRPWLMLETDKKVLLIGRDIRKPDIHRKFNLKNEEGFAELLAVHTEELARPTN